MNNRPRTIRNIVFDIGNVIVRWNPQLILSLALERTLEDDDPLKRFFADTIWIELNLGRFSESEAMKRYAAKYDVTDQELAALFHHAKDSQVLNEGTVALMHRLSSEGYRLFALSDNVHEIVAHLKDRYDFWQYFEGAVISAEVGHLKPSPDIFNHLLDSHRLNAEETVFFDDMAYNVDGAMAVGMHAFAFTTAEKAQDDLLTLGVSL